jgi:hypothetical protein
VIEAWRKNRAGKYRNTPEPRPLFGMGEGPPYDYDELMRRGEDFYVAEAMWDDMSCDD